jgi:hypothetical protein
MAVMKYRITEGVNSFDGSPIFRIYKSVDNTWIIIDGTSTEENARKIVGRLRNPAAERVIEEFGE